MVSDNRADRFESFKAWTGRVQDLPLVPLDQLEELGKDEAFSVGCINKLSSIMRKIQVRYFDEFST